MTSKKIEQFLNLCNETEQKYKYYIEVMEECNRHTADYLHALELEDMTYNERGKLQTKERKNRKERRLAKDIVECLEPLREYLNTPEGKKAHNTLQQVLGKVRRIERYHANRTYRKRAKEI